jgi:WD40 repeat protein
MDFQGRYLAVLSDADMVASAYLDGQLGPRSPEMRDELTLFPLQDGLPGEPTRIPVSNAVTAWPSLLALSKDGRFAYVAETDRPAPDGATTSSELKPSPTVRVLAIGEGLTGKVVQEVDTAGRAQGLSLHPRGDLLAVNVVETDVPQIGFLSVAENGLLGALALADLPGTTTPPRDLAWSPDGELLAATFPADNAVRFYRVRKGGSGVTLEQVGEPVVTGKFAGVGHWAPDSGHFFVTNLYWFGGAADLFVGSNVSTLTAGAGRQLRRR